MSKPWSTLDYDEMLEAFLPCESREELDRACVEFAQENGRRTQLKGIVEGEKLLRRLSYRRLGMKYQGPANDSSRTWRGSKPFTWVERQVLKWAFDKKYSDATVKVSVDYIANLLQRSVQEVEEERNKKYGIKGFVL